MDDDNIFEKFSVKDRSSHINDCVWHKHIFANNLKENMTEIYNAYCILKCF